MNAPTLFDATGTAIPPSLVPTDPSTDPAIAAYGTQIQVLSNNSPEEFTNIAGVGDITGPGTNVGEIETTSHSTGIPHKTFMPTLIDDGDLAFPCYFNPADPTHSLYSPFGLENLFQNRAITKFRLVNTDPSRRTREFRGFVKQLNETYPVQGIATRATTIRISGVPTDVQAAVTLAPTGLPTAANTSNGGSIAVTSASDMSWMPISDAPWLTVSSPTTPTTGDGSVVYAMTAQLPAAPARTGHIKIGDQTFTVTQLAGA